MLERYGHGGDLRTAAELYGRGEQKLLDYSSNMNPLGPPPAFQHIIESYWQAISAYPDPAQRELLAKIAKRHAVGDELVLAGNGAAELIELVVRYIKPNKAAIFVPSFIEYEQAIEKAGCPCMTIATTAAQGFAVTLDQLRTVVEREQPELIMLGYPNNPTGALLPRDQLDYLLHCGAYIVIDEAFLDFHPDEDQLTAISNFQQASELHERLFVIRSMTKFYSIPGIRLGYVLAGAKHITALKQLQVPWSVNSLAQLLGIAALEQAEFALSSKRWLAEEIPWFAARLQQIGLEPFPTVTNYILVRLSDQYSLTSEQLQQLMGEQGILIRDAGKFRGLSNRYIRLAIKDRASNELLLRTMEDVLHEQASDNYCVEGKQLHCETASNDGSELHIRQPFREKTYYHAACIAGLEIVYDEPMIVMRSGKHWEVMSNAVHNGGLHKAAAAVNYRVPLHYESDDPQRDMLQLLQHKGLQPQYTAGFMTAAKLSHAAIGELAQHDFAMLALATAGTSNATRAGSRRETYRGYTAGTINIFIWLDARMSQAAMVNAIMTATEAKSAALADLAVVEGANGQIATGTSTDAVYMAVSQAANYAMEQQYAGTATELGCRLGELVYAVVHKAVQTQQEQ